MNICKICDKEIEWDHDYNASCHSAHKMTHHKCYYYKKNEDAKRDFERTS